MQLLLILCTVMSLFAQMNAYASMRSKKKTTAIGPTCTQGGHNPLPPSGVCPQSNDTCFPRFVSPVIKSIRIDR
jgi:hypothetical protein